VTDEVAAVPENYISLQWADGDYEFRLGIGQVGELQTKCDAPIGEIYSRLMAGRYVDKATNEIILNPLEARFKYEDITETIRLSLVGGNKGVVNGQPIEVSPTLALKLVRDYVYTRPLLENWKVAAAILNALMIGYADPDKSTEKKSPKAATAKATTTSI